MGGSPGGRDNRYSFRLKNQTGGEGIPIEDSSIIDLYFERSEQAIVETQMKYGRLCGKIASGTLTRPEDAEEAVSSSYLKLWNAIPPKRPESLCGYLCRIVRS